MANHQARAVRDTARGLLLYAPIVRHGDFHHAIAYLVRRLDENTSPENFLHDIFSIKEGNAAWERQKGCFLAACARKDGISAEPARVQDRGRESYGVPGGEEPFRNAADTDWSLRVNCEWIRGKVEELAETDVADVPLVIAGGEERGDGEAEVADPSRPGKVAYKHALAGAGQIERALACAEEARAEWIGRGFQGRAALLRAAVAEIAKVRGDAVAVMVMDAGKSVMEGDAEVSEAMDFANYYSRRIEADGAELEPFGTVVVTPPWNFPFAIPCGGVLAPLVAGNTVILKPAPETVLTAWVMVRALWRRVFRGRFCSSCRARTMISGARW